MVCEHTAVPPLDMNAQGKGIGFDHRCQRAYLLASTIIMATVVVLINRLVWRKLYRLASTRFKLET